MGFFSSLFNAHNESEVHGDITPAMKAAGIYSRSAYDRAIKYAGGFVYMYEEQLKEQGVKLGKYNRGEYADVVRKGAAASVYDAGFLARGESEEFGDVIARFFLGDHETLAVHEMFVLERAGSLMK